MTIFESLICLYQRSVSDNPDSLHSPFYYEMSAKISTELIENGLILADYKQNKSISSCKCTSFKEQIPI